jgi:hypothetical protein
MIAEKNRMSIYGVIISYVVSLIGGHFIAGFSVIYLKRSIDSTYDPKTSRNTAIDWSIGIIERGITTTLVIWAPSLAGPFIGGWIALKFAANWDKRAVAGDDIAQQNIARHRLVGIVGSCVSLIVAVAVALIIHPMSLSAWVPRTT